MSKKAQTLGELKASGYQPSTVRQELRRNLRAGWRPARPLSPGCSATTAR